MPLKRHAVTPVPASSHQSALPKALFPVTVWHVYFKFGGLPHITGNKKQIPTGEVGPWSGAASMTCP